MKDLRLVLISLIVIGASLLTQTTQDAHAVFHLIRIHAVMGGLDGNANVQYVELRMCSSGQSAIGGHSIRFFDGAGTLKATFTFPPGSVTNSALGESILIATTEFNAASVGPGGGGSGGDANFVFSASNTVGANGGDPLHPVQGPSGKVTFATGDSDGCDSGFGLNAGDVDSVAYGTAPPDFGTAAPALPSPSDNRALRESNISGPANNSTDYSLQPTASAAKTVAQASLTTDLDTPRNNARQVARLVLDTDADGVADETDNCPNWPNPAQNLPPWSVPANDPDCDGFSSAVESSAGTLALVHCGTNAWPADIDNDGDSDITDISTLGSFFGDPVGDPPNAPARYDLAPDPPIPNGVVDISDIVKIGGFFAKNCA